MNLIENYIKHGFALVPVAKGQKRPTHNAWNIKENVITELEKAKLITGNVGLAHAYCLKPTAVLDIDDLQEAKRWLKNYEINLDDLLNSADAVQIHSGKINRAKLLYLLPKTSHVLPTHQITNPDNGEMILEFRCATSNGKTAQDLIPPSTHPDTGNPYSWAGLGNWENPPTLPEKLLKLWTSRVISNTLESNELNSEQTKSRIFVLSESELANLKSALFYLNSDERKLWIDAGMALKSLGITGRELWLEWSMTSHKYDSQDATKTWLSLKPSHIDYRFIFAEAQRLGWVNPTKASLTPAPTLPLSLASKGITAEELSAKSFPPLNWVLPDILPEGCYLLSARPKVGKSWLALQISLAVACGSTALGKQASIGKAIYLALEDNQRRLQDRLKQLRPQGYGTSNLILHTSWRKFDEGGLDDIEKSIEQEKPRLIIIDTLAKVRPNSRNNHVYENDYKALAPLTALANKHRCCIVVITHNRKGKSDTDALEQISGSLGLSGAVDGALVIDGIRTDKHYKLSLIGRDIPNDDELAISRQPNGEWHILGQANQVFMGVERKELLELLALHPKGLKPKDISDLLGKKPSAVRKLLLSMVNAQQVLNNQGIYVHPTVTTL